MYRNKNNGIIGIVITIIILIFIVIFSNGENKNNIFENFANNLVMPIQNGMTYMKHKIGGNQQFISDVKNLKDENNKLKSRNSELEQELRELEKIKTENETLKEYMNLKEKYGEYKTVPSYVINKDVSNYSKNIIINVGSKDGIKKNMTVIGDKGLVGHVVSVSERTSKVQTIIDTASSVSSTMSTSKDTIICRGMLNESKQLEAKFIPTDANIIQGDNIVTSGLGGIYPKGIHVGKIKKINNTKNIIDRTAIVETAVDFDKLDTVLVITQK